MELEEADTSHVTVCGVTLPLSPPAGGAGAAAFSAPRLVPTPSTLHNARLLALVLRASRGAGGAAAAARRPVLLEGPTGCGKTSIVRYLAGAVGAGSFESCVL